MAERKRRTVEELEAELRGLHRHRLGDHVTKVLTAFAKWGSLVWIAVQAKDVGIAWAGKTTLANIRINAAATGNLDVAVDRVCGALKDIQATALFVTVLAILFAVSAIAYGRRQAKLRRDAILRLSPFEQMYERIVDPGRTTSGITPSGETRDEDR